MNTFILDGIWGGHTRWETLRKKVADSIGPARVWHYDNSGEASIEVLGARLAGELSELEGPFNLVGYSMGGLVIREAMRQAPALPLRRAAMLHSPHSGTLAACLKKHVACREMRPGSAFLRRLAEQPWNVPTLVTWCPADLMVFPGRTARWSKATHFVRSDVPAHAWPVISTGIHGRVVTFLRENSPAPLQSAAIA